MTGLQVLFQNMNLELTEAAAESGVLLFCEVLITKDDYAVVVEDTSMARKVVSSRDCARSRPLISAPSGAVLC
jgi:hypothetical protein